VLALGAGTVALPAVAVTGDWPGSEDSARGMTLQAAALAVRQASAARQIS
jgi:hypothetical protein